MCSGFLTSSNPFQAKRRSLNRENIDMEFIPCSIKSKIHRQYNVRTRNNTYGLQILSSNHIQSFHALNVV